MSKIFENILGLTLCIITSTVAAVCVVAAYQWIKGIL